VVVKKTYPAKFKRNQIVVVKKRNVRTLNSLPNGYTTCVYRKNNYYYHGGFFYRNTNNIYHVIAPPRGIKIKVLPVGYRKIMIGNRPHFYFQGVYYKQVGNEFETVEPEVGTIVPDIPQDVAEQVTVGGESYYEFANVLYKSVETPAGTQYQVAGELEDETED
jgi:hypothetical protein